jgi:UDP-4-amino-4-deoxy-L-arabinose formyltransferase/UDP-glucuronic acid dehydrogenase (UDP-4-keto-hexauronic acid decarboxylating)
MRVAIIGRTEILYDTAVRLKAAGHEIVCILTAKEAPEYNRGREDFRKLASDWSIPFASSAIVTENLDFLAQSRADIGVSINYSGVIPLEITSLFRLGILNAHGGDLPRYRGNACQAWAILNGEEKIGLCIHRMIGGELDSGDIIERTYLPININTTISQVMDWIGVVTPRLFIDALERLQRDPKFFLERQPKEPERALRCYPRRPEDGRIDWRRPARDVLRLINASGKPYAGAFCEFEEKKMILWSAELVEDNEVFCAVPGQVTALGNCSVDVSCGAGKIRIHQVQVETQIQHPRAWINSIRTRLK